MQSSRGAAGSARCPEFGDSLGGAPSAKITTKIQDVHHASLATAVAVGACRAALRRSPAMCRNALTKHRACIGPSLSKILEIVGDYEGQVKAAHFISL